MTKFIDELRSRRSIRLFQDKALSSGQVAELEEALLRSPTSRGRNPWHFVRVEEREVLQKLSLAKMHGSTFLGKAALAYVICADETVSDVWIEDCAIAAITLQYAAHSCGLGSCWAQIRLREHDESKSAEKFVQQLLDIPETVRVASVIGIGYPDEVKEGHPFDQLPKEKLHRCKF